MSIEAPRSGGFKLQGCDALVLGLGASGRAAALLLQQWGAQVTGVEEAPTEATESWARIHLQRPLCTADDCPVADCDLLILSPGIPTTHPLVQRAMSAQVPVWSEIELAYRFSQAPVIAITGSKGKSTTASLLGHLWKAAGKSGVVAGNIGLAYSAIVPQLQQDDWVILEVSSFQLETVHDFHPRVAVHLPVTPDHLDRYAGMPDYAAAKARIARQLTRNDLLVVDVTDPWSARVAQATPARCVGIGTLCDGRGVVVRDGAWRWIDGETDEFLADVADLSLVGRHNVHNATAALAVLCGLQVWTASAAPALRSFEGLAFRMQPCGEIGGVRFLNDSKSTTVESVRAAVSGLDGPLILALGGRNKGLDFTPLRETLTRVRRVLVFGEAATAIDRALQGAAPIEAVADLPELVRCALQIAEPGDTVLFSPGCTSFDMFENAEARGRAFSEAVDREREARRT